MKSRVRTSASALVIVAGSVVSGCRGGTSTEPPIVPFRGMHEMPRYDAQEGSPYFEDGRTMRPPVDGAVAREMEIDPQVATGLDAQGRYIAGIPSAVVQRAGGTAQLMRRGEQRYNIYCSPCHGYTGDGNGMVTQRANALGSAFQAANLTDDQFMHMPDGRLYLTITNGVRTMPAYRAQIPVQDRWAITAYVRALQLSQGNATAGADPDGDGVFGSLDACPTVPEDRDGAEDTDGCVDPDNDSDGLLDADDQCAYAAGPAENGGCPTDVVRVDADRIAILRPVEFADGTAELTDASLGVLDVVRSALVRNPTIARVVVEGHTDIRGAAEMNRQLSEARAQAVVGWLSSHGVEASRLEAQGLGATRPIGDNTTDAGRSANRRVEFHIRTAPAAVPTL